LDLVEAELRKAHIELDEIKVRLLYTRTCLQSEAQSRQTLQRGLGVHQRIYFQLAEKYKSIYEKCDQEKISLKEDLRISEELIRSQRQLIELYQSQQQQPASHLFQGGPLLSQYNDHNQSCQYSPYQPPGNHEFIDPTSLRDFDYSIGLPVGYTEPAMSTPVAEFEDQTPNLSIQSVQHPVSAERDVPGPTHTKSEKMKRGLEDEEEKPSKKRRTK
jgi:hypothetical protein